MKRAAAAIAGATFAVAVLSAAGGDARRSGYDDMTPQTQAMQRDDAQNPAMLWVQEGAAAWDHVPDGAAPGARSCRQCHGSAETSMKGVAARYPAYDEATQRPITLAQRLNACRVQHQAAAALALESQDLLSMQAYVSLQSRGMPIAPPDDPRLAAARAAGERLFHRRIGQLDLSCAQCHDERAGGKLAGALIPQGHATGYPIYRLEWQGLGSLQRRLRGCISGVRAEPYAYGSEELVDLELYLAQRAAGMKVESPAVRP